MKLTALYYLLFIDGHNRVSHAIDLYVFFLQYFFWSLKFHYCSQKMLVSINGDLATFINANILTRSMVEQLLLRYYRRFITLQEYSTEYLRTTPFFFVRSSHQHDKCFVIIITYYYYLILYEAFFEVVVDEQTTIGLSHV